MRLPTAAEGAFWLSGRPTRFQGRSLGAMVAERRREADSVGMDADRARHVSLHRGASLNGAAVTVRFATAGDARALERLAALDSGSVPQGAALVAEVEGELLAALPLGDGRALADPLRPTAELVRLLELRAAQLRGTGRRRSRRPGLRWLANRRTAAQASGARHG